MKNLQNDINLLLNLYKSKKILEAESLCKKLIKNNPRIVFLYNVLGIIFTDQKKTNEAINIYEKGLKIDPNYAMIYNNLGNIYKTKNEFDKAEDYYKKSIKLDNNIAEPQNNLGTLYGIINKNKEAVDCYKKAININPKYFISYYNLGLEFKSIGKFKEAKKYFLDTIKINSNMFPAHRVLSSITKYTKKDKHFKNLIEIYKNKNIPENPKMEIFFALGKAYEDLGDFGNSIKFYKMGNDIRKKNILFSIEKEKKDFDLIKRIYTTTLIKKFDKLRNNNKTPIFIVGMPRSGTTLIEQILSSHSNIFGGDELFYLPNLIKKYFYDEKKKNLDENINLYNKENINNCANEYIKKIKLLSNNSVRVTDKLPINFKWIGLIKLILPNSKIIHCTRNPKDNCLSIYKNLFVNPQLNFAYNLDDIFNYYNIYINLIEHWKKLFPNYIFDVKYENVIINPTKEIRSMLNFCELNWEKNCLKFYNNKRVIRTASDFQARKKLYKGSINYWKNYKKYLGSFFSKFD